MSSNEDHLLTVINGVTLGASIPGVALSILILSTIAYLQWNPVSRPHLDRVSFRLLIYALIANVVFGSLMFADMKETTPGCSLVGFLGVMSPLFASCMFCCVALNLALVLVYGVNGKKTEKFYLFGAVLICAACTIPMWVAGEFGWYAKDGACWLKDPTPSVQLHWLIGAYSVPMLLMSLIEVLSFVNIVVFMIRHEARFAKPLSSQLLTGFPQMRMQSLRIETVSRTTSVSESGTVTLSSSLPRHPVVRFRSMIIRIALYPLLSCFLSSTACILDVYSIMNPDLTDTNINLRTLNLCIYSFRPLLYALLAGSDPSFIRALQSLRQKSFTQPPWTPSRTATTDSYEQALELARKYSRSSSAEQENTPVENKERRSSKAEEAAPAVVVVPTTTKAVVKPTATLPATVKKTTAVVATTAKVPATTKAVVPPTKATLPATTLPATTLPAITLPATTPAVVPATTLPLTTSKPPTPIAPTTTTPLTTSSPATSSTATSVLASLAASSPSPSPSPSTSVSPSSSTSVTAVAAGVIGGLVGIAVTGLLVAFFLRRWHRDRRRSRESINFDAKHFRRSAVMLDSSPPSLREPEFRNGSVRSMRMDYHPPTVVHMHHPYPYIHPQPSPYPDTPAYGSPEYPIAQNPFYVPAGQQGYPPPMHRQGSGGHPGAVPPPHYHYGNHEDAYGGM
ncbi:hypothetical protein DFH08DRAFT_970815 [Mycena albidolilacea]|uniref:receptor protein-tyrosine kinase n=1 Tax=Mycena albidolilacea TaxID=1033008 RepID=A0AAD6ZER9_9AGAR|nr:hypothetical protein DFH08DRAFT_970815 [Mycena albidolilacea]